MDIQTIDQMLEDAKHREDELRKDREALERVRALLGNGATDQVQPRVRTRAPVGIAEPVAVTSLSAAIREAIEKINKINETITSNSIRSYINASYPSLKVDSRLGTLSSVLSRMVETGYLEKIGEADKPGKALSYRKAAK